MKNLYASIVVVLLSSCAPSTPPKLYKLQTPQKEFKEIYHETIGLVVSHKKSKSIAFGPQSIKPLTKNILNTIHPPAQIQKSTKDLSLFTKHVGHEKSVKFFIPVRLQSFVSELKKQPSFQIETVSRRGIINYTCTKADIEKTIPNVDLLEVHLTLDDREHPLSPSETIQIRLPIGKKEQLLVPKSAICKNIFVPYIYILNEEGKLEKRNVRLGNSHGDMVAIINGLTSQEQFVLPN